MPRISPPAIEKLTSLTAFRPPNARDRFSTFRRGAPERANTARRLSLHWGVVPIRTDIGDNLDEASARTGRQLVERGLVTPGAAAVFVSINPDLSRSDANYLKIQRL